MDAAVRSLVDDANRAGGRDNITALAFRLEDAAAPQRAPEGATLVGPSAEEAGLTGTEVRRRAAAAAAAERRARLEDRSGRRRGLRTAGKALVALLLVAAVAFGAWYGNRQVWFLGTDDGGRVALYRGLPFELPLGIDLYSERYATPVQTDSLSPRRREAVTGHELRSRSDAVDLIEDIELSQYSQASKSAPTSEQQKPGQQKPKPQQTGPSPKPEP
jgi:protein phosphatase